LQGKVPPIELGRLRTVSIKERKSKVSVKEFARAWREGGGLKDFLDSLPFILAGKDLKEVIDHLVRATRDGKMILLGMGAHPIKVGLNPIIIDLMKRGVVRALAFNGACMIHDVEVAMAGHTSEEVEEGLKVGNFGVTEETATFIHTAMRKGREEGLGAGEALGKALLEADLPFKDLSLFATGFRLGLPLCVHVAIGTDVIHIHPSMDGALLGEMSFRDFRTFCSLVASLKEGAFINLGSAVVMPEVFLKALTLAKNMGQDLRGMITVNLDFLPHYRPLQNVVVRPELIGAKGYFLRGHHEIMFPLLAAGVIEGLKKEG